MKNVMLVCAVTVFALVSCAKDYTCECVYESDTADSYTSVSELRNTKKEAEKNCDFLEGTSYSGSDTYESTCTLK